MKKIVETMNLEMSFTDKKGFVEALDKIKEDYLKGRKNNNTQGAEYSYKTMFAYQDDIDEKTIISQAPDSKGRVELVGGKMCLIIPSSMNYE